MHIRLYFREIIMHDCIDTGLVKQAGDGPGSFFLVSTVSQFEANDPGVWIL